MRLLVVLPYAPSKTRVRARMLLETLAPRHQLTLVALAWGAEDRATLRAWRERGVEVHAIAHGPARQIANLTRATGGPFQERIARSASLARVVRALIAAAAAAGRPYDALHVEHLRGAAALDLGRDLDLRVIFDAVDCLAALARQTRAHNPNPLVRLLAAAEERQTRTRERAYIAAAAVTTVVAERELEALRADGALGPIAVVPNGVAPYVRRAALQRAPRVIFTGKLSYHANAAAVRALLHTIWPQVRAAIPTAQLQIAGAKPPRWLRRWAGRDGVELIADPPSMMPLIAEARVAVAPMAYGVGIQNKVLEAMACGVPVVATPAAAAGFPDLADGRLLLAQAPALFARHVVNLLTDDPLAERVGRAGQEYVRARHSWDRCAAQFEALYAGDAATEFLPVAAD